MSDPIITVSECDVIAIPSGHLAFIPKDSEVILTQALGDSFSVEYEGNLYRVAGKHAAAIGLSPPISVAELIAQGGDIEEMAWRLLKICYDPEIPVDIVNLGLIYGCNILDSADNLCPYAIHVVMTLTSPTCGMGPILLEDIKEKLQQIPKVKTVTVELVFDPAWSQNHMSDAAKLQLGLIY
jgi:probable FeS assembly SUF system protein SufT